jgi:hypothetical protein
MYVQEISKNIFFNFFSDRETSLTRVGSLRLRDNSLPRMREVALPSLTSSTAQVCCCSYFLDLVVAVIFLVTLYSHIVYTFGKVRVRKAHISSA